LLLLDKEELVPLPLHQFFGYAGRGIHGKSKDGM
jgi:hypothetical protein